MNQIDHLLWQVLALQVKVRALEAENRELIQLAGLLSRPRDTKQRVTATRDALLRMQTGRVQ